MRVAFETGHDSSDDCESSDSERVEDFFAPSGERLEDDEELRLHYLGSQQFFSTWFAQTPLRFTVSKVTSFLTCMAQGGWSRMPRSTSNLFRFDFFHPGA